jgi:hypothetical protein
MQRSNRATVGSPKARLAVIATTALLLVLAAAGAVLAEASPAPGLVTEAVEPGVERIINDGAGHDLDERHPTFRYDMDGVFVAPDGTVWLNTSYRATDNDANPPGGLVWALGVPGTAQWATPQFCFAGLPDAQPGSGITCYDPATDTQTRYLVGTFINAVAAAPDGSFWAVGADGGENGGLYHITPG